MPNALSRQAAFLPHLKAIANLTGKFLSNPHSALSTVTLENFELIELASNQKIVVTAGLWEKTQNVLALWREINNLLRLI